MAAQLSLFLWIMRTICFLFVNIVTRLEEICSNSLPGRVMKDEPFEDCAAREIREETGMEAGKLQKVGEFYLAPGYSTEFMAVFLATELKENPLQADDDEFLQVEKIPLKKAVELSKWDMLMPSRWQPGCWQNLIWRNILTKPMMILIAGPYRSGTMMIPKDGGKCQLMESLPAYFPPGTYPVLGEWFALPLLHLAGSKQVGDEAFNEIFHPIAERCWKNAMRF